MCTQAQSGRRFFRVTYVPHSCIIGLWISARVLPWGTERGDRNGRIPGVDTGSSPLARVTTMKE